MEDFEDALKRVSSDGFDLGFLPDVYRKDPRIVLVAVFNRTLGGSDIFQYADEGLRNDEEFVRIVLAVNGMSLKFVPDRFRGEKELVLTAIRTGKEAERILIDSKLEYVKWYRERGYPLVCDTGYTPLQFASTPLREDREVVMAAVEYGKCAMKYASKELQSDKEFALEALSKGFGKYQTFEYLDESLRGDRDIVIRSVTHNGKLLELCSEEMKGDKEVLLAAVSGYGGHHALKFASDDLKNDKDVVRKAVKINTNALEHASNEIKMDQIFILSLQFHNKLHGSKFFDFQILNFIDPVHKKDKKFALKLLELKKPYEDFPKEFLDYFDKEIWGDQDFVLSAVDITRHSFQYASDELKKDKVFILTKIIPLNAYCLEFIDPCLKKDRDIFLAGVKKSCSVLKYADPVLKSDEAIAFAALEENFFISMGEIDQSLKENKEFFLAVISRFWRHSDADTKMYLDHLPDELKQDKEVVYALIDVFGPPTLKYLDPRFRKDVDVAIFTVVQHRGHGLEYFDVSLWKERRFVIECVRSQGKMISKAELSYRNDEEVLLAALEGGMTLGGLIDDELIDPSFANDVEFARKAVVVNGGMLDDFGESIRKDRDLVKEAVKENGGSRFIGAHEDLRKDVEFVKQMIDLDPVSVFSADQSFKKVGEEPEIVLYAIEKGFSTAFEFSDFFNRRLEGNGVDDAVEEFIVDCCKRNNEVYEMYLKGTRWEDHEEVKKFAVGNIDYDEVIRKEAEQQEQEEPEKEEPEKEEEEDEGEEEEPKEPKHQTTILDFYHLPEEKVKVQDDQVLGTGSFGTVRKGVYEVKRNVTRFVAVKEVLLTTESKKKEVILEFKNQLALKHPNVLEVYGYIFPRPSSIGIVMELMDMDLHDYVTEQRPSLSQKVEIMKKMVEAVHFLHHRNPVVLHRDIKTLNFLVTKDGKEVKICDFGLVKTKNSSVTYTQSLRTGGLSGTTQYMAPESFASEERGIYSVYTDIYALGITFWAMLFAKHPYEGLVPMAIMFQVMSAGLRPKFEWEGGVSGDVKEILESLLKKMWHEDPKSRPDTEQLRVWFSKHENELSEKGKDVYFPK